MAISIKTRHWPSITQVSSHCKCTSRFISRTFTQTICHKRDHRYTLMAQMLSRQSSRVSTIITIHLCHITPVHMQIRCSALRPADRIPSVRASPSLTSKQRLLKASSLKSKITGIAHAKPIQTTYSKIIHLQ